MKMRAQYSVIFFMLCLNISCLLIYKMSLPPNVVGANVPALASAEERQQLEQLVNPETSLGYMNQTSPIISVNVPILGDLWSALRMFADLTHWIVDGFPHTIAMFGVPTWIAWALRMLFWFSVSIIVIEFIFGRPFSD